MIRFDLICENDHEFDSWFADNKAFDDQKKSGFVTCPFCNSGDVNKQLMLPSIPAKSNKQSLNQKMLSSKNDPVIQELKQNIRKMRQHVSENAEYVGKDFAKEAREIHHEEKPPRGIFGEATLDDAKSLIEEGVNVMPLPSLPEDEN